MRKKTILIILAALVMFALSADAVFAWTWGQPLVPCGTTGTKPCARCDLYKLLENLFDFVLIGLVPVAGGILFTIAGFYYVISAGNPSYIAKAKDLFKNTVIGIAVISLAWLITNTLIVNLAQGSGASSDAPWYTVQCTNPTDDPATQPPLSAPPAVQCAKGKQALAADFKVSNPGQESGGLQQVKSCLLADEEVARLTDMSQLYTKDRTHDFCNYTMGLPICESCSHSASCHYASPPSGNPNSPGSQTGFVEGVDFNAKVGSSEYELCKALTRKAKECGVTFVNFEGNHTHISTNACKKDQGKVGTPCY